MLKLTFCYMLLFCTIASLQAQHSKIDEEHENFFRFGFKGGVNINKVQGQSFSKKYNYNYQLGGFVQFNFSKKLGLQPEINFVQSRSEFSNDASDVYDDLFRDGTQKKARLNQIEVPILLNVNLGESKRIKLQAGPVYGKVISETTDSLLTSATLYKQSEWSIAGGLWIQLPLIHLGARYKYGLTNINNIDNRESWRNQAIQLFLGLTF